MEIHLSFFNLSQEIFKNGILNYNYITRLVVLVITKCFESNFFLLNLLTDIEELGALLETPGGQVT